MECSACGGRVETTHRFCGACGRQIQEADSAPPRVPADAEVTGTSTAAPEPGPTPAEAGTLIVRLDDDLDAGPPVLPPPVSDLPPGAPVGAAPAQPALSALAVPRPATPDAGSGGSTVLMVIGLLMAVGGAVILLVMLRTDVGLSTGYTRSVDLMAVNCGSKLEWVIGGGPALPSNLAGGDVDARTVCHEYYDGDVAGWRAQAGGAVALILFGGGIAWASRASRPRRRASALSGG